jgi:hypothetical protein
MTPYSWAQLPSFTASRDAIETNVSDWDLLQWSIEETICENPCANSHTLGDNNDSDLRYFRTWDHPGTSHLPRLVVVFRIDREPTPVSQGLVEAHLIVRLSDLGDDDGGPSGPVPFLG